MSHCVPKKSSFFVYARPSLCQASFGIFEHGSRIFAEAYSQTVPWGFSGSPANDCCQAVHLREGNSRLASLPERSRLSLQDVSKLDESL